MGRLIEDAEKHPQLVSLLASQEGMSDVEMNAGVSSLNSRGVTHPLTTNQASYRHNGQMLDGNGRNMNG